MTLRLATLAAALLAALPATAAAQVGYTPPLSPYRDLNTSSRLGLYGGYYIGASDEAGVLPKSGPLLGARWDVFVGGPGDIAFRVATVQTDRTVIDPAKAQGTRVVGTRDVTLVFADVGLSFNITGIKSWNYIVPILHGSVGIVSDFGKTDVGGFKHGSTFALGYGAGIRYVRPQRRLSFRMDLGSYMYSLGYPTSYYAIGGDGTSVLGSNVQRTQWRQNWTLSAGLTYQIAR